MSCTMPGTSFVLASSSRPRKAPSHSWLGEKELTAGNVPMRGQLPPAASCAVRTLSGFYSSSVPFSPADQAAVTLRRIGN